MTESVVILGIDPGLNITGYGVVRVVARKPKLISYGHIKTNAKESLSQRLYHIFESLETVLEEFKPDRVAIEDVFYAQNVKTAIVMGHARGVAIAAAMKSKAQVNEYTAREVKQSVVGSGSASKEQVKFMVRNMLRIKEEIKPDDASDGLAIALCGMHRMELEKKGLR